MQRGRLHLREIVDHLVLVEVPRILGLARDDPGRLPLGELLLPLGFRLVVPIRRALALVLDLVDRRRVLAHGLAERLGSAGLLEDARPLAQDGEGGVETGLEVASAVGAVRDRIGAGQGGQVGVELGRVEQGLGDDDDVRVLDPRDGRLVQVGQGDDSDHVEVLAGEFDAF